MIKNSTCVSWVLLNIFKLSDAVRIQKHQSACKVDGMNFYSTFSQYKFQKNKTQKVENININKAIKNDSFNIIINKKTKKNNAIKIHSSTDRRHSPINVRDYVRQLYINENISMSSLIMPIFFADSGQFAHLINMFRIHAIQCDLTIFHYLSSHTNSFAPAPHTH